MAARATTCSTCSKAGNDTADGGGGNDVFNLGAALHSSDHIDGGSGSDTLNIDGDYSARTLFNGDTFSDIETLHLAAATTTISCSATATCSPAR